MARAGAENVSIQCTLQGDKVHGISHNNDEDAYIEALPYSNECILRQNKVQLSRYQSCSAYTKNLSRQDTVVTQLTDGYVGKCKKVGQYLLGRTIGEGSYGKVRLATHLMTKQQVAVKVVHKKTLVQREAARRHFRREALLLQRVYHPNVTRLYQALETGNSYYLVFELAAGGNLLHLLSRKGQFSESESRFFMRQIVSAVDHLHRSDIVHRDLKLDNVLLDEHANVKLVDFGLSAVCQDSNGALSTQCGSPLYAAPEVFAGRKYGKPVDIWSLGVCLHAMISGRLPFLPGDEASLAQLYSLVLNGCEPPSHATQSCQDLLSHMMEVMESKRIRIDDIISHPWLTEDGQQPIKRVPPVPRKLNSVAVDTSIVRYMCAMFRFSERDVIASVTDRKLTAAGAAYHILQDSINSGRVSFNRSGTTLVAKATSASGHRAKEKSAARKVNESMKSASKRHEGEASSLVSRLQIENSHIQKEDESIPLIVKDENNHSHGVQNGSEDLSTLNQSVMPEKCWSYIDGNPDGPTQYSFDRESNEREPCHNGTTIIRTESSDSGVGAEVDKASSPADGEIQSVAPSTLDNDKEGSSQKVDTRQSYKMCIMNLRRNRQKSRFGAESFGKFPEQPESLNNQTIQSEQISYVLLGKSPRRHSDYSAINTDTGDHSSKHDSDFAMGDVRSERLRTFFISTGQPSPYASLPNAASCPPVVSSQNVFSSLGYEVSDAQKYSGSDGPRNGSFQYGSKPVPGFRHGNKYFLHVDKTCLAASNLGVKGIPQNVDDKMRPVYDNQTQRYVSCHNVVAWTKRYIGQAGGQAVRSMLSAAPPPPPNSSSCSLNSSDERQSHDDMVHEYTRVYEDNKKDRSRRVKSNPLPGSHIRLHHNNPSLRIDRLTLPRNGDIKNGQETDISHHTNFERLDRKPRHFHGAPEFHTQYNNVQPVDPWQTPGLCIRGPPYIQRPAGLNTVAALRDPYNTDSWKSSRLEKESLLRQVKRYYKQQEERRKTSSGRYPPTKKDESRSRKGSPKKPVSTHLEQDDQGGLTPWLNVPAVTDEAWDPRGSWSGSDVSTPITPEKEEYFTPVTRVTIKTIGATNCH